MKPAIVPTLIAVAAWLASPACLSAAPAKEELREAAGVARDADLPEAPELGAPAPAKGPGTMYRRILALHAEGSRPSIEELRAGPLAGRCYTPSFEDSPSPSLLFVAASGPGRRHGPLDEGGGIKVLTLDGEERGKSGEGGLAPDLFDALSERERLRVRRILARLQADQGYPAARVLPGEIRSAHPIPGLTLHVRKSGAYIVVLKSWKGPNEPAPRAVGACYYFKKVPLAERETSRAQ